MKIYNYLTIFLLLVFINLVCFVSAYAGERNYSSFNTGAGADYRGFSGSMWQPEGDIEVGTSGSIQGKISCDSADFSVDYNGAIDKFKKIIKAILPNPDILIINESINIMAYMWAVKTCGGSFKELAMSYPDRAAKLLACAQYGVSDSNKLHAGGAVGTASFASLTYETTPGQAGSIIACITHELADEMGEYFRTCLKEEAAKTVNFLRTVVNWTIKWDMQKRWEFQKSCILDAEQKEYDLVDAVENYADDTFGDGKKRIISPDGTAIDCNAGECTYEKVAWADFALTVDDDKKIKNLLVNYLDESFESSTLDASVKKNVYEFISEWFAGEFINGTYWQTKKECDGLPVESGSDAVLNAVSSQGIKRIDLYSKNSGVLKKTYFKNKAAKDETVDVMKNICVYYDTFTKKEMFRKKVEQPVKIYNSAVIRDIMKTGQDKNLADMEIKRKFEEVQKTSSIAKASAENREISKNIENIRRVTEEIKN